MNIPWSVHRTARAAVRSPVLVLVVLQIICGASSAGAGVEAARCARFSIKEWQEVFQRFTGDNIKNVQRHLFAIGYDPHKIDGLIGIDTSAALNRFCLDFTIERTQTFAEDVAAILSHYAEVASTHEDWKDILLSDDFESWINDHPAPQRVEMYKIRRSGTAPLIIALLDAYKSYTKQRDETRDRDVGKKEFIVSFKLTDTDLDALEEILKEKSINNTFIEKLNNLINKAYENKDSFISTIKSILKEINIPEDKFINLSLKHGKNKKTYRLTEKSFEKLIDNNITKDIAHDTIKESLRILDKESEWNIQNEVEVSIRNLKSSDVSNEILKNLEQIKNLGYGEKGELKTAIQEAVEKGSPQFTSLSLGEAFKRLIGENIPEELQKKIEDILKEIRKENEEIIKSEIRKVFQEINEKYANLIVSEYVDEVTNYGFAKESLEQLAEELESVSKPANIIDNLRNSHMLNVEYIYESQFQNDLMHEIRSFIDGDDDGMIAVFTGQAKKEHRFSPLKKILWEGEACGCSDYPSEIYYIPADGNENGVYKQPIIYGFYPFWPPNDPLENQESAAGQKPSESNAEDGNTDSELLQKLDFSLLSRIGYFAVPFDNDGNIFSTLHWKNNALSNFISITRTYQTDVDLVIYNDHWEKGGELETSALISLAEKIAALAIEKHTHSLLNKYRPYISMGGSSVFSMADGITIYLDFNTTKQRNNIILSNVKGFILYLKKILDEFKEKEKDRFKININLMTQMNIFDLSRGKNISNRDFLKEIEDKVDNFLIFLYEPTTDTKKILRENVEILFKGNQRRRVLRKIIPVISAIGHEKDELQQFQDDIIYFHNNFGGVGFWHIPTSQDNGMEHQKTLIEYVKQEFQRHDANLSFPQRMLLNPINKFCRFACPHRWGLRIIWDLGVLLVISYWVLYIWIIPLRDFAMRFWWSIFVAHILFAVFTFMLVRCGFIWTVIKDFSFIFFIIGVVIVVLSIYARIQKRADYP